MIQLLTAYAASARTDSDYFDLMADLEDACFDPTTVDAARVLELARTISDDVASELTDLLDLDDFDDDAYTDAELADFEASEAKLARKLS